MMDNTYQWNQPQGSGGLGQTNSFQQAPTPATLQESQSKIRDAVAGTEQLLSDVHEAISALEKRLDTVLTPVPPNGVGADGRVPQQVASHLLGRIGIMNEGFAAASMRLRSLAQRVEV